MLKNVKINLLLNLGMSLQNLMRYNVAIEVNNKAIQINP